MKARTAVLSAGIIFSSISLLQAQLIDVDFNNNDAGAAHGGPNPGPTMSGAAVLGAAGDQWNGIDASSGTGVSLINADGSASAVTMTFTSDSGYDANSFGGSTPFAGTPWDALMEDYLFNGGVPQTITLSGLVPNSTYEVVLYNAADVAAASRETFFTVNADTQGSTWDGASSTLTAGVDYVDFPAALSDGSGNLVITYTGNGSAEGDVDGFQIEAVLPPAPTVAITSPAGGIVFVAPANLNIAASASVSSGTVADVQFFINGSSLGSVLAAPYGATANNLSPGTYALTAVATTAGGISTTSLVVNVSVISQATFQTEIGVDFNNDSYGALHGGPNPGPTMTGVAVLGTAGDQWNGINVNSGAGIPLIYADGSASGVTMTFTSGGGYDANAFGGSTPFAGTPYDSLMEDYLFNGGVPQTITLSGLAVNSTYSLILYNAGDAAAGGRETFFTVNNNTQSSTWDAASSTLILGVDYVYFPSALSDGSGNLVITYTGNGTLEGDVDGFQLQGSYGLPPAPTVSIISPPDGAVFAPPVNVVVTANAAVSIGTVANVQFFMNGISLGSAVTPPFTITANNLTAGAYAFTAVATAGGISTTSSVVNVSVTSPATEQPVIDVDFNNDVAGASFGGPNPGPTMTGAAVLGEPGDQWNGIDDSSGSGIPLFYTDGSASSVTMAFTSDGGFDANSFGGSTPFAGTPYDALMEDYLFNGGLPQTITLSGLAPNTAYNLVLYNAADAAAAGRETFFTVNGVTMGSVWNGTASTLIAGVDYVNFTAATSDTSGNLVITYAGNSVLEGDVDGFQIQGPPGTVLAPTVSITSPADGTVYAPPANVAITANAVVTGSVVTNVQFFTNGVSLGSVLTAPFSITANNLTSGSYALTAVATAVGISVTSSVVNVSVITFQTNNSAAYTWTTFAGRAATGSVDGVGSAVQFSGIAGVAVDAAGNIYVTDSGNDTIRKITAAGVSSTIAGFPGSSGTDDGLGGSARFFNPEGIAVDSMTNLYVADTDNNRIRKITPMGSNWVVRTIAGSGSIFAGSCDSCPPSGGYVDGDGTIAQFNLPIGIAVDDASNLYVADSVNNVIRQITPSGGDVWTVSTIITDSQFSGPSGVAVDGATNIYVADNYHEEIRKIAPGAGTRVVSTLAGNGTLGTNDGTGAAARFFKPVGIALDSGGNLYVTDQVNDTIRKITSAGVVSTLAGSPQVSGSADGTGEGARFSNPFGVALDTSGNLYVADSEQLRKISSAGVVRTLAGLAVGPGSADGTGGAAQFSSPGNLAVDGADNVYVADAGNNTVRQITSAGVVSTVAGLALTPGTNDGAGGNARFGGVGGLALNNGGSLYVADSVNNTIRQITPAGLVSTLAGQTGTSGSADGTGSSAQFNGPGGVAVAGSDIFVADTGNNTIRKIVPRFRLIPPGIEITSWTVTTLAGSALNDLGSADGTNGAAKFFNPRDVVVDASGNIYVADSDNHQIRKVTPVGTNWVVTTIAGQAGVSGSADGFGTNALFADPTSIAIDATGNLYVADQINSTIRKLTPVANGWLVNTIGGMPGVYASEDGAGSAARFNQPDGVTVDSEGNVYVADSWNNTIRKGVFTGYGLASEVGFSLPPMNATLVVTLTPTNANGQWRFPWEVGWRNSGQAANNLVAGNYPVEFRAVPGWLAVPQTLTVAVGPGAKVQVTNEYYPTITTVDTNDGGALTVTLGPSPPDGAGWRFLGDTTQFYPSGYSTNLVVGTYLIQFAAVSGRVTPPNLSVQVQAGLTTTLAENYLLAGSAPAQAQLPVLVPSADIGDLADFPFGFDGQLQTDVGYGSGVAVETNVVLTAAHLVFNDQTLSYVNQAYWYFQRETGVFEPEPMAARGWYVLSGYAAQRTNDLAIYAPDTSTPQSRNLDVAALYFLSPVAGGGYGGYLPSDASPNPWLTGNSLKMLAGYPVDGSEFGDASIANNAGMMYQTEPQPFPLALASDPVADQQVYTASWIFSYPGNSGGPFYVQFDGYYYPAGVYLGTLFNGVAPYASAVRAIDSNVVNMITQAAALGDSGTNNSGGGVITVIPGEGIAGNPGLVEVTIAPPAAAQAGGAWKFSNLSTGDYSTKNPSALAVTSTTAVSLQFKSIVGWNLPTNQSVTVSAGSVVSLTATYTPAFPLIQTATQSGSSLVFTWSAVSNQTYQIQFTPNLAQTNWNAFSGVITATNSTATISVPIGVTSQRFYRVMQLP